MDGDKLNRWLTLLANIAVVAGIVFLGLEINQNNIAIRAQAKATVSANRINHNMRLLEPDNADLVVKVRNGDVLTEAEAYRDQRLKRAMFLSWESEYQLFKDGLLDFDLVPIPGWRVSFATWPGLAEEWHRTNQIFSQDFVQFVETHVIEKM
jgi:hypothetical protein